MNKKQFKELVQTIGYNRAVDSLKNELNFKTNLPVTVIGTSVLSLKIEDNKGLNPNSVKKYTNFPKKLKKFNKLLEKQKNLSRKLREKTLLEYDQSKPLPKSEQWFRNLYDKHFKCDSDLYNSTFKGRFLPDVVNHKYKYIIEVDGSVHNLEEVKARDLIKTQFYRKHKYRLFRIKAYSITQYVNLIKSLEKRRKSQATESFKQFLLTNGY